MTENRKEVDPLTQAFLSSLRRSGLSVGKYFGKLFHPNYRENSPELITVREISKKNAIEIFSLAKAKENTVTLCETYRERSNGGIRLTPECLFTSVRDVQFHTFVRVSGHDVCCFLADFEDVLVEADCNYDPSKNSECEIVFA